MSVLDIPLKVFDIPQTMLRGRRVGLVAIQLVEIVHGLSQALILICKVLSTSGDLSIRPERG